jgi:hypothetical protein
MGKLYENKRKPMRTGKKIIVGRKDSVPPGRGATVKLKDGGELALFNVGGDFYAIENFCPHKAYPLADSCLKGNSLLVFGKRPLTDTTICPKVLYPSMKPKNESNDLLILP